MNIELTPEIQQIANAAVASGGYDSVADFIAAAVREKRADILVADHHSTTPASEWSKQLHAFAARHKPTGHPVDDSREAIYPDRN